MDAIQILVCLDENYLPPLRVMLTSLLVNNPDTTVQVWLLHQSLSADDITALDAFCAKGRASLQAIQVDSQLFENAPASGRYSREMYYRLLAPHLLPSSLHRILYLDPDILIINPLQALWDIDMKGNLFVAAAHTSKATLVNEVNKVRLGTESDYFNSGVLLMNLDKGRKEILPQEIFDYVEKHEKELLLPDQDVMNALYGERTLGVDDTIWNYDARNYRYYMLRSGGQADVDWMMKNTAILHFCGSAKPWQPRYPYRFGILFKHYQQMATR